MTDEITTPLVTRRQFKEATAAESLALVSRIFDWRAAAAGLLLSGLGIFGALYAEPLPVAVLALLGYVGGGFAWVQQRRRTRTSVYARLLQLTTDTRVPADHANTAGLSIALLSPVDAADLDTLDRLLFYRPDDRRTIAKELRVPLAGQLLILLGSLVSIVSLLGIAARFFPAALSGHDLPADFWRFTAAMLLGAIPSYLLMSELTHYQEYARRVFAHYATVAEHVLPGLVAERLARGEGPYTTGRVIRWDGSGYTVNRSKLTAPPQRPGVRKYRRVLLIVVGCLIAVVLALSPLLFVLDVVLGPI